MNSAILVYDYFRVNRRLENSQLSSASKVEALLSLVGVSVKRNDFNCQTLVAKVPKLLLSPGMVWRQSVAGSIAHYDKLFDKRFDDVGVVYGWEMPKGLKNYIDQRGLTYVEFRLAPFRNARPQKLLVQSNCATWRSKLWPDGVTQYQPVEPTHRFENGSDNMLIIGQCWGDAAIVNAQAQFSSLDHFSTRLESLAKSYSQIYYKPHPLSDGVFEQRGSNVLRKIGVKVVDSDVYGLLTQLAPDVIALSSSVLDEAREMGLGAYRLLEKNTISTSTDRYRGILCLDQLLRHRSKTNISLI